MEELRIETILESSTVDLGEINGLQGKRVEIVVRELKATRPKKKRPMSTLGTGDLGGRLDYVNITDYAHDD